MHQYNKLQNKPIEIKNVHTIDDELFIIKKIRLRTIFPIIAKRPFFDATMGPFQKFKMGILEITDDEGFTGECEFPVNEFNLLQDVFAPILLNNTSLSYKKLHEKLYWNIRNDGFRGNSALALGHLDRVFYDLAAKRNNQPLYQYLGVNQSFVEAYGSGGGTNLQGDELLKECLKWEKDGYDIIKMKFGGLHTSIKEDIDRICFVRNLLKPETKLAVDANQSMSLKKSLEFVKALEGLDIAWLEEPIHSASLKEIAILCKASSVPISYGESERSSKVFPSIVDAGVKHLQPIVGHISCFKDWLEIGKMALEKKLQFSGGGNSFYNCQFVAAAGNGVILEYLEPVMAAFAEVFLTKPTVKHGQFHFPDAPGLGITIDWKRLEKEKRIIDDKIWK
ncbi:L-alanine-DL-glutamate epimerase-like enolase superfamily enzyme [Jejuia pallidilutea]|uniref:L-alanine-DL-glutamate epimerase-like enolase superfamily enzyme n=1 Tax=Jejuia pallidilutea TaxID=504487 RepID=A0A362X447_9FLAO|nr:mandelate racemase/muconate lactonizing enzyme family protein [Jejuia pallidilutea]PQV51504.1 L-alanine-DL-glutamate epimerase-like enolase superfamily enzyme [Jejuia pallidilutea]